MLPIVRVEINNLNKDNLLCDYFIMAFYMSMVFVINSMFYMYLVDSVS